MTSQLGQDQWVLSMTENKTGGYFVEFGACDGVSNSNTYLLEKEHGWSGLLAEPAKCFHEALPSNRSCRIDYRCVSSSTGDTVVFMEAAELSTIKEFNLDHWSGVRNSSGIEYPVTTVSLLDLLQQHSAPKYIDYLSLDTEGSEFSILSAFDFSAYYVHLITVEHNFTPAREDIRDLLESKGFVYSSPSDTWDDWYVNFGQVK